MNPKIKIAEAENPIVFTGLKLTKPKLTAAGVPAVLSSAKHIFGAMPMLRGIKALNQLNQKGGIDCPGCAWPDPDDDRSGVAEYCENGAKAIAEEATTKKLDAAFFANNSVYDLSLLDDYNIGKKGRVAQPMYLAKGDTHYREISWADAFAKMSAHLKALASPHEAIFYTSGRTSNEAAFLYQLFVREFGTNNLPDCSNMCHESSGVALTETVGIGKGSVKLEDFYNTEVIIILGQNPGTNHPRMLSALKKAKENGATIISINPIIETGLLNFANPQEVRGALGIKSKLTDIYLQVKINDDMALLKAIMYLMLQAENKNPNTVFDTQFIKNKTTNYDDFIANIQAQNLQELVNQSGVELTQIQEVADILIAKKKIIACWAMGLTQHKDAVATIQDIVNILLLKGSIGKPGAGTCPVRGHSNVQGDRTMGIYEKPSTLFLNNIQRVFNFTPPTAHGYDVVDCIHAMHQRKATVFIAMGGNFLSATPDTTYTAQALRNCALTVHVSTKLNRSHLVHGAEALILPCLARTDAEIINGEKQFVSVENSMGVVSASKGSLTPISKNLLSEAAIVCHLAIATLGNNSKVDWQKYLQHNDFIRDSIEKTIPGFDAYNQRIRIPEGFYLPNGARYNDYQTATGKANFTVSQVQTIALQAHEYVMMTIRSHDQFNTTIYGLDDRYRGILNERRVVLMNELDMQDANLHQQQIVDIHNTTDGVSRVAKQFIVLAYNIPRLCVATYFPEANVLVPITSTALRSNTPTSKSVVVTIVKAQ
jgi:molybdopterin-dependent oxidoreductase alpha subunit